MHHLGVSSLCKGRCVWPLEQGHVLALSAVVREATTTRKVAS